MIEVLLDLRPPQLVACPDELPPPAGVAVFTALELLVGPKVLVAA